MKHWIALVLLLAGLGLASTANAETYLLSVGRASAAPDPPWNNWVAHNTPSIGASITLDDLESGGGSPVTITLTDKGGSIVSFKPGTATTDTLFGHSIPAGATITTFSNNGGSTGFVTFEISGLPANAQYFFEGYMRGAHAPSPTTWTISNAGGSDYTNSADGLDQSSAVVATATGTIEVRFDFTPGSGASGIEAFGFQEAASAIPTVGEWGLIAMGLLLAIGLSISVRRIGLRQVIALT